MCCVAFSSPLVLLSTTRAKSAPIQSNRDRRARRAFNVHATSDTTNENMASLAKKIVVVGGGNSAGYFARAVAAGRGADLCIVGAEDVLPYERPALSKAFLHKEGPPRLPGFHTSVGGGGERQTQEWYDTHGVEVMLSTRITAADLATKTLTTDAGTSITYDKLVVAVGCTALKLPPAIGGALPGVHYVRDNADALALYDAMAELYTLHAVGPIACESARFQPLNPPPSPPPPPPSTSLATSSPLKM
jgi:monodehydroascorbate reductase (NADH)